MTQYYVSTTGSNSNSGSATSPWKTIDFAMRSNLKPGDEVIVKPGTYNERVWIAKGGDASHDVILRSEVPGGAKIVAPTNDSAVLIRTNYITVEGFDVKGGAGHGIEAESSHHVTIRGNIAHDSGGSGITTYKSEFILVEDNIVYGNSSSNGYQTSGISIGANQNVSGDTTTGGFRTIVRNNISYSNIEKTVPGDHTDGNGIIIDWFRNEGMGAPNYTYPTLVEGNLVYNNGGKGIQVYMSDNVTVRSNTSYHNNVDLKNSGTARAELSNHESDNSTWINNIAVADPGTNKYNSSIMSQGSNVNWYNNLTFNGTVGQNALGWIDPGTPGPTTANGNKLGVNPMFVDPAHGDFRLATGSPAIDGGTSRFGLSTDDLDGGPRTVGTVDIGAYETDVGGSTPGNRAPVATPDTGTTGENTPLVIRPHLNDTDADGNTLSVTSISTSGTSGRATLQSDGSVSYDPSGAFDALKAGQTGTDKFTYTVSDGKGGTATGTVTITVTGVNDAPVAGADSGIAAQAGKALTISAATLLANDRDAEGATLSITGVSGATNGTVTLDAQKNPVFTATAGFTGAAGFDYTVSDGAGGTANAHVTVNVGSTAPTTPPPATNTTYTFFSSTDVPKVTSDSDRQGVELGVKFRVAVDGEIDAIRFFKGSANTGPHTAHLWNASGQEIASGQFTGETAQGWQQLTLTNPVAVSAGDTFTISYYAPKGGYAASENYFSGSITKGSITALGSVYKYGSNGAFPTDTYKGTNYWVDGVFDPTEATKTGTTGNESLSGGSGADVMLARAGSDTLLGLGGADVLRGQSGDDILNGGAGQDVLIGGTGADTFVIGAVDDSPVGATHDIIRAGDGAIAMEGVGVSGGDRIDLSAIDANTTVTGNQAFTLGSTATGGVSLVAVGTATLLQANTDGDAQFEVEILIEDGNIAPTAYTLADFVL